MPEITLLRGANVALPGLTIERSDVLLSGGKIAGVAAEIPAPEGAEVVDLSGLTLAPGFIDVHVHGGGGHSLITTDPAEIAAYAKWAPSHGVTSFLATICAADPESGIACAKAVQSVRDSLPPGAANILGVNFEGPFVSPERSGALPKSWLAAPDRKLFDRLLNAADVRLMTIAPEVEGALDLITSGAVRASVGHTDATYDTSRRAFEAGASHVTHAFNAMRPLHHRDPGPIGAAIESDHVTVEVIADGVHLHPATVRLLMRALQRDEHGRSRVCLITDAVTPAGLESGTFRIGSQEAKLSDGSIRLPDGTIAGSAATMDTVVRNVVEWGCATLISALQMASAVPARVAAVDARKGRIAEGSDADLVALTDDLRVAKTWVAGQLSFSAD